MRRRNWQLHAILAAMLLTLLAACGGAPATEQPTGAPAAAAPTAAPAEQPTAAPAPTTAPAEQPTTAPAAGEKPKLTVWLTTSYTPEADALQKQYVQEWATAKGVDVTIVQDSATVIEPQLNAATETKTLPDVISWASPSWAPKLYHFGLLLDVSDIVAKNNSQGGGLYEPAVRAVTDNGKQFAVPTHSATEVFYVRKDLLAAKGLQLPKTWADVVQVGKALTDKGKVWGWGAQLGTPSYDAEISLLSMLASYGASPYAEDGKTPNLNNDGTRQVIALIKDAWDAGAIPQDAVTWDDSGNNKAYLTGAAAMIYNTGSVINAMRKDNPDLLKNTEVIPIPSGPQGQKLLGCIYGFMISKDTKYPDLAKDLLLNTLWALIISYQTFNVPFCTWLLLGYFRTVPEELEDAARIDGCSRLGVLGRIVLPLAAPGIVTAFIFGFTNSWNEFLFAVVMAQRTELRTVPAGLYSFQVGDVLLWGQLMAAALIATLPVVLLFILVQRFVVQGLTVGAVKG